VRLYVASAFVNKFEVQKVQKALRKDRHTITHDWTKESADHLEAGSKEFFEYLYKCGDADFFGVLNADALVVVAHPAMSDTKAELGIALGAGIPVYVLWPERRQCVFYGRTTRYTGERALTNVRRSLKVRERQLHIGWCGKPDYAVHMPAVFKATGNRPPFITAGNRK